MEAQPLLNATWNTTRHRHIPASCPLKSFLWVSLLTEAIPQPAGEETWKITFSGHNSLTGQSRRGGEGVHPRANSQTPSPQHFFISSWNTFILMPRAVSKVYSLCRIWGLAPLDWKTTGGKNYLSFFLTPALRSLELLENPPYLLKREWSLWQERDGVVIERGYTMTTESVRGEEKHQ